MAIGTFLESGYVLQGVAYCVRGGSLSRNGGEMGDGFDYEFAWSRNGMDWI